MKDEFAVWTPVKTKKYDGGFSFSVWGRTYTFDNSFLPTEITTVGRSVLFTPVSLNAEFGDIKGDWEDFWYLVTEETEESVTVLVSAKCENIVANATVTVEFDGFVKLDFRIMSSWQFAKESDARLTALSLNMKLKAMQRNVRRQVLSGLSFTRNGRLSRTGADHRMRNVLKSLLKNAIALA